MKSFFIQSKNINTSIKVVHVLYIASSDDVIIQDGGRSGVFKYSRLFLFTTTSGVHVIGVR